MKILIIYGIYENPDYGIGIGISIYKNLKIENPPQKPDLCDFLQKQISWKLCLEIGIG